MATSSETIYEQGSNRVSTDGCLVGIGTHSVLRAVVGVRTRVGVSIVQAIGTSLVGIHWHQVLHVLSLLEAFLTADASSRGQEHDGGNQQLANPNPGDDV